MTKCIATRLKNNLIKIINKNQSGFIKGRYIGDNIRSLLEVIDLAEDENLSCIALSIDFEKAFDTISWKLKKKILSFFNFGESFQQWIKVFFTDITSCVLYTGWTTQYFSLSRGVRQIYQISPYLFLLCAEIVGIAIRQSKDIKGFCFKRKEIKLSQYADDTHILLDGSEKSVRNTVNLLNNLTKISRLRDNYNKSELASLGRSRMEIYTHNFSSGMKITVDKIKILGITIPTNGKYEDLIKLYYDEKRGKIKKYHSVVE
jgi:hypothetical protein